MGEVALVPRSTPASYSLPRKAEALDMQPAITIWFVRVSPDGLHRPPTTLCESCRHAAAYPGIPAINTMEDRQARHEVSSPAIRLTSYLEHQPNPLFVGQGKEHSPARAKVVEPQSLRVRHTRIDEDRIYRPRIVFNSVAVNDGYMPDVTEIRASS